MSQKKHKRFKTKRRHLAAHHLLAVEYGSGRPVLCEAGGNIADFARTEGRVQRLGPLRFFLAVALKELEGAVLIGSAAQLASHQDIVPALAGHC